ncbi:hypothetical protein [Enterobacter roggenkampii]|uniref:hypothetical protein n=1 Tax=Enterobacter roggenkampii TaxID=1812935 RepID=UPI0011AE7031|nr:hypothetical protein [Enterobacter roggenkampii]
MKMLIHYGWWFFSTVRGLIAVGFTLAIIATVIFTLSYGAVELFKAAVALPAALWANRGAVVVTLFNFAIAALCVAVATGLIYVLMMGD